MMKFLFAFAISLSVATSVSAQVIRCYTTENDNIIMSNNSEITRERQQLENFTKHFSSSSQTVNGSVYVIPVVFHILHNYGRENISDAQIIDQMNILNADFRKLNADTSSIVSSFQSIAADAKIEFRLAGIDPFGNCTNGIDRIVTPLTNNAGTNSQINGWPNDQYLNIWVVNSLAFSGVAAISQFPGGADSTDGVLILHEYVGSIGTGSPFSARTLTHELGHYFNLNHPWGNINQPGVICGDDDVNDTPITKGWTFCNLTAADCTPPIVENVQNFMEFSYCRIMFTEGQKLRMHATLNDTISGRNNLWTPANLLATGVATGPQTCTPIADFSTDTKFICEGSDITFIDLSYNGQVVNRSWSFPGGSPTTSTDSNPVINYPSAGTYSATLVVSNATGTDSITKTSIVHVSGIPQTTIPFYESFEDTSSFPGVTGVVLNDDNGITWNRISNTSVTGLASLKIDNYSNAVGQVDEWILPFIDFSNITDPIVLTFFVANAQRSAISNDELSFSGSFNCGNNWIQRYNKSGTSLATTTTLYSTDFTPDSTQWRMETVSLNPYRLRSDIRLKFTNTSDNGNNTFIDDINITGTLVNVDEADEVRTGFTIYPNPANSTSTIQFKLSVKQNVSLAVKSIMGQNITNVFEGEIESGLHEYKLSSLAKGIYLIELTTGNKHHIRRLIIS